MRELLHRRDMGEDRYSARSHGRILVVLVRPTLWARGRDPCLCLFSGCQAGQGGIARAGAYLSRVALLPFGRMCPESAEVYGPVHSCFLRKFCLSSIVFVGEV